MKKEELQKDLSNFIEESPFPWWQWDIASNVVEASRHKVEMLGYNHSDFAGKGFEAYTDLLHKEDYERTMDSMRDLLKGSAAIYQVDYRILARDGTYHWYMDRGSVIKRAPDGSPRVVRGIVIDLGEHVTESAPAEKLLSMLRNALPADMKKEQIVTICSSCMKIRSENEWFETTDTLRDFITLPKSHGLCPECIKRLYPEFSKKVMSRIQGK